MRIINGVKTVPLNGWRTREICDYLFGDRFKESRFEEDEKFIIPAKVLQDLPDWDGTNTEYVNTFSGDVIVEVIEVAAGGYGVHVSITPAPTLEYMEANNWTDWSDFIKIKIEVIRKKVWIGVYFKDIRPEDNILNVEAYWFKDYERLERATAQCGHATSNDLIFKIVQLYGHELARKIIRAGVL